MSALQTCRSCGIASEWNYCARKRSNSKLYDDYGHSDWFFAEHFAHWECLCKECNRRYNNWFKKHERTTFVEPDERVLVDFLAHRLRLLSQRKRVGLPILRCAALTKQGLHGANGRCTFFQRPEGGDLCGAHHAHQSRGTVIVKAHSADDWRWAAALPRSLTEEANV